ncbi:hypothetical protein D3C73_991300 [compost metagenome]
MTDISNLHVSDNGLLFKFDQVVTTEGLFREEKIGMIEIVRSVDASVKSSRWATVLKVGPGIIDKGIVVGAKVLIEQLQWSRAIKLDDGTSVWKTDESKLLAVGIEE